MKIVLSVHDLTKRFGGVVALDHCSLSILEGQITGLIGPNGAGKSTLLNTIAGLFPPDEGGIRFREEEVAGWPAYRLAQRGLVRTFQIARELGSLTVLENLLLARPHQRGETVLGALFARRRVRAEERENVERAREALSRVNLWHLADSPASALSGGQKKLLELARALMLSPSLILLDEPAAGVAPPLVAELSKILRDLRDAGVTFVVIEHNMEFVRDLCDQVHVLREGHCLVSGRFAEVKADARVIEAYLGQVA